MHRNSGLRFAGKLCAKASVVVVDPVKPIKLLRDRLYSTSFDLAVNHGAAATNVLVRFLSRVVSGCI